MSKVITIGGYQIYVNEEQGFISFLKKSAHSKIFILVDGNTRTHCLPSLQKEHPSLKKAIILGMGEGERYKTLETCQKLWEQLAYHQADRYALVINLGGGVVTDLGGFMASSYKRGIDFINVPTTLLAQVDASVGGKVGVDLSDIKNVIGLYSDPEAVFISTSFLGTLPQRQLLNGFVEIIKYALINDDGLWSTIREIKDLKSYEWYDMIITSLNIKKDIVEKDPFEKGERKVLNFGHTIGHAIESLFLKDNRGQLLHGEAVATGLVAESYMSHLKLGLGMSKVKEVANFIITLFGKNELRKEDNTSLLGLIRNDKKNINSKLMYTLLKEIGKPVVDHACSKEDTLASLEFYRDYQ